MYEQFLNFHVCSLVYDRPFITLLNGGHTNKNYFFQS